MSGAPFAAASGESGPLVRLAVLGSPIAHSKSPVLHAAAYRLLGLDWQYGRAEVEADDLRAFVAGRGRGWRGMSLTMPLKDAVIPLCRTVSPIARRAEAVNTIVFASGDADAPFDGHNTDVEGVRRALDEAGVGDGPVEVLGAGNTASSVLIACAERGARDVTLRVRSPQRAAATAALGESLGMRVRVDPLEPPAPPAAAGRAERPSSAGRAERSGAETLALVVNTIPGGTELRVHYPRDVRASAALLDVVYDPWPTALAAHWLEADGTVVSGLEMLLHQAVAQVRLFVRAGDGARDVSDAELVAAMRAALAAPAI